MKILVTGGAGFIGSHLSLRLLEQGHSVHVYDNLSLGQERFLAPCRRFENFRFIKADLLDLETLRKALKGIELVYHLAANSDILEGTRSTDRDLKMGTLATYNVLEGMRLEGVRKIAFASTSAIYGEAKIKPTPESYGPLIPISLYGASKLACEALLTAFCHNFDFQVWIYRFANIVGSHATHGAIYDFIERLKKDPSVLKVLGNGTQKKSYLHVDDCVNAMIFGVENLKDNLQILNLASEKVTDVRFIAEETVRVLRLNSRIEFGSEDRGWKGDVPFTWLDGSEFAKLGWKAKLESTDAVSKAIRDIVKETLGEIAEPSRDLPLDTAKGASVP